MRRNDEPYHLAWYAVSAGSIGNNKIIISNSQSTVYFRPARSCEHIRNVWFASSGTVVAAWNRVRLVNARRGPGFFDFEGVGAAYFRRYLAGIGRERVARDGAPGAPMKTKQFGVLLRDLDWTPQTVLQFFINFHLLLLFFVLYVKIARYLPSLESPDLFHRNLSAAVAAVETTAPATVAAAQHRQQLEQYTAATVHICRAPYLSRRRTGPRVQAGVYHAPKWVLLCRLVCRVGREYKEQYMRISNGHHPLHFRPARNCEHILQTLRLSVVRLLAHSIVPSRV